MFSSCMLLCQLCVRNMSTRNKYDIDDDGYYYDHDDDDVIFIGACACA